MTLIRWNYSLRNFIYILIYFIKINFNYFCHAPETGVGDVEARLET